jgi:hypothetical protein
VPVPAEHLGKARQLRRNMTTAATASRQAMEALLAPLREQLSRRPTMRAETIAGAMRAWRLALPPGNRVSLSIQMRGGLASIDEQFIASSQLSRREWGPDQWEPGLCLASASIRLAPRKVTMVERDLVACSLHAIGRRFERGANVADRSDEAVVRDLVALFRHDPDRLAPDVRLVLPAGSGSWVGQAVAVEGKPVLLIRSFFDQDMTP